MNVYVASKSSNIRYALDPDNIIEVCCDGPDPQTDAEQAAKDWTKGTEQNTYVFSVSLRALKGFKIYKEVTSFVPPKP